jgi:hypothetical protein
VSDSKNLDLWREDRHSFSRWSEDQRVDNGDSDLGASNPLADLLVFLSDGFHTGTLHARALAFLFVLRPDLLAFDLEGGTCRAVAAKAGLSEAQLACALRDLRESAPEVDQAMRHVRTSRARFLALAELKSHRREILRKDRETMAKARCELAPERVRQRRKRAREWEEGKRLRVARQVLALADPLLKAAAEDMRAFDRSMGLKI